MGGRQRHRGEGRSLGAVGVEVGGARVVEGGGEEERASPRQVRQRRDEQEGREGDARREKGVLDILRSLRLSLIGL